MHVDPGGKGTRIGELILQARKVEPASLVHIIVAAISVLISKRKDAWGNSRGAAQRDHGQQRERPAGDAQSATSAGWRKKRGDNQDGYRDPTLPWRRAPQ